MHILNHIAIHLITAIAIITFNAILSTNYKYLKTKFVMKKLLLAAILASAAGAMVAANNSVISPQSNAASQSTNYATATTSETATAEEETSWVEVTLESAGSLGVEILYKVDALSDVKQLRITGPMNDTDWATIKNCNNLKGLDLSKADAKTIHNEQFRDRTGLKEIILSPTLQSIGEYAFYRTNLSAITIPASVTSIGKYAFYGYDAATLSSVVFEEGSNLRSIGEYAFQYCTNLKSIDLPDGITYLSYAVFQYSGLETIKLPSHLREITSYAFYSSKLTGVDFPESLTSIGDGAFYGCNLTSVTFPESVTNIGNEAFRNNVNLTDIELPSGLLTLSSSLFRDCAKISNVVCHAALPPSTNSNSLPHTSQATLTVPTFSVVNYKLDSYWMGYHTIQGGADTDNYTISGSLSLTNDRRMNGTPSLTMNAGSSLIVGGSAAMPLKTLRMWCDFSNHDQTNHKYSSMVNSSPAMSADQVLSKISLYAQKWHFICLPFNVKRSEISSSNANASYVIRYYDGASRAANNNASGNWKNVGDDEILAAGRGYIIQASDNLNLTFPAMKNEKPMLFDPNEVSVSLDANTCENKANSGWNLIGNTHQSYYDMYYSMLTAPVTVWDFRNSRYVAYSMIDDNLVLTPNQPFFIQADEGFESVEFSPAGRQLGSTVTRQAPARAAALKSNRALYDIILTSASGNYDNTRIVINNEASEEYETQCDASKFFSDNAEIPMLYTVDAEGNSLAINERPEAPDGVRLCMIIPAAGEYTIRAPRADSEIVLKDLSTGKSTRLDLGDEYRFVTDEAGIIDSRFVIYPTNKTAGTNNITISSPKLSVNTTEGELTVSGACGEYLVICTTDGVVVVSENISEETVSYTLAPGIYIVKAGTESVKCTVK